MWTTFTDSEETFGQREVIGGVREQIALRVRYEEQLFPFEDPVLDACSMFCIVRVRRRIANQCRQVIQRLHLVPFDQTREDTGRLACYALHLVPPQAPSAESLEEQLEATLEDAFLFFQALFEGLDEVLEALGVVIENLVFDGLACG